MEGNPRKRRRTLESHGSINFIYDVLQWTIPLNESTPAYRKLKKGKRIESPHFSRRRQEWHLEMQLKMDKFIVDLLMTDHFTVTHLGWKDKDGFVREDLGHPRSLDLQILESDKLMESGALTATCRVEREERRKNIKNVCEPVPFRVLENNSQNTFGVVDHFSEVVEWKIPDFLSLERHCISSPPFRLAGSHWRMTVYLGGSKPDSCLSVYLRPEVPNTSTRTVFYVGLLTQFFNALQEIKRGDTEDSTIASGGVWGWFRFLCLEELWERKFITSSTGSLTFTCRAERTATSTSRHVPPQPLSSRSRVNPGPSTSSQQSPVNPGPSISSQPSPVNSEPSSSPEQSLAYPGPSTSSQPSPVNPTSSQSSPVDPPTNQESLLVDLENLSSDLKDLLSSGRTCDFTVIVQSREFRVHKAILSARSPVFRDMFERDTEAKSGILTVSDCHRDSFGQFIDFLYTGKIGDMSSETALQLYATAEKYDVKRLKSFCADYLRQNLNVDNVCSIVILSDQFKDRQLESSVQEFFNDNSLKIFLTSEWGSMVKDFPRLAQNLLKEMATDRLQDSSNGNECRATN